MKGYFKVKNTFVAGVTFKSNEIQMTCFVLSIHISTKEKRKSDIN